MMKSTSLGIGIAALMLAAACAERPTAPNLLADLARVVVVDSTGTGPPDAPPAPGFFRGVVMGYEPGIDTLANAERLPDVTVSAFQQLGNQPVGDPVATTTSDADGEWQLATMPAGEYIVTFRPPPGSKYRGAWTIGNTSASSGEHRWWIMLPVDVGAIGSRIGVALR